MNYDYNFESYLKKLSFVREKKKKNSFDTFYGYSFYANNCVIIFFSYSSLPPN